MCSWQGSDALFRRDDMRGHTRWVRAADMSAGTVLHGATGLTGGLVIFFLLASHAVGGSAK